MTEEEKLSEEPTTPTAQSAEPTAAQAPAPGPAPESKSPLTDQKKNALLRYMAILFGVAFLLVALSFLIQMRDSNQQISQLSKSNASALQNAGKLQDENQALTEENSRLTDELEQAREEAAQAAEDLSKAEDEMVAVQEEILHRQELQLAAGAADSQLFVAIYAALQGDVEECRTALKEVDRDALGSSNSVAVYGQLVIWLAQ